MSAGLLPRRAALLGGTTTGTDALTAAAMLLDPRDVVRSPGLDGYERAFASVTGATHGVSFAAARVGLYGLLRALGVGPGDEVLIPLPTHIVVANAVRYLGARPIYVDCRPDSWNIDLDAAQALVTPCTRAVLVQHTFGAPADLDRASALAERHGLALIEDCVHALGAAWRGRPVGSFGIAGLFSTEETKTISTTMGGMVVTRDDELWRRVLGFQTQCEWPSRSLTAQWVLKLAAYHVLTQPRLHRLTRPLYERLGHRNPLPGPTTAADRAGARPAGYERRLSAAQARIGLRQLRRLAANVAHRGAIADLYRALLAPEGLRLATVLEPAHPAWVRFPVWVDDRERAVRALRSVAVPGTWFTSVLEEADTPDAGDYEPGSCPNAEDAALHLVNLPTHPRVNRRDAEAIAAALAGAGSSS